jgi:hypothetical protein
MDVRPAALASSRGSRSWPLGVALLAAWLLAGCTDPAPGAPPAVEPVVYLCAPELPPGTPCIQPHVSTHTGDQPEPILEPDVVVEDPVETDYEGPRAQ